MSIRKKFSSLAILLSLLLITSVGLPVPASANAIPISPVGPTNLEVVEVTARTVSLQWDGIPGVNDYWVWHAVGGYITYATGTSVVVGGLNPETTYSFIVGQDPVQYEDLTPAQKSNAVTFTTLPDDPNAYPEPPLTPPHQLLITDITDTTVTLNWGASPGATGYDLYVNGAWEGGTWDNNATSISFDVMKAKKTVGDSVYSFVVGAQKAQVGQAPESSKPSNAVTIKWGELEAPKELQAITVTRTTAFLGWAGTPGAASYDVYKDNEYIGSSESNRFVAEGLAEGKASSFTVIAKNKLWESPASAALSIVPGNHYNLVTYFGSWSVSETGRNYKPSDMNVSQLTHINYAFADVCWKGYGSRGTKCQSEKIPLQEEYVHDGEMFFLDVDRDPGNLAELDQIRTQNPHLKMLMSVGGWNNSKNFSDMAATEITRRAFANSIVDYVRAYKLDGIDIDWEYPVSGGLDDMIHRDEDKENFTTTMQTVRAALDAAGSMDGKYYLLTIASAQSKEFVINADLANSTAYLDFINIMTYDYSGPTWSEIAHHNSPLFYDRNHPLANAKKNNVYQSIQGHLDGGVPTYKLLMGVPFYGKGWVGCPETGEYQVCDKDAEYDGKFGTWEPYIFDYTDIIHNFLTMKGTTVYWNDAAKVPYLYNSEKKVFFTYDDEQTMAYKAALVKSLNLAGTMSWQIDADRDEILPGQLVKDLPINNRPSTSVLSMPTLAVQATGTDSVTLKWESVAEAAGYDILSDQTWLGYTTDTEFTVSKLTSGTTYPFYIMAVQKTNDRVSEVSVASNVVTATTTTPSTTGYTGYTGSNQASNIGNPAATKLNPSISRAGDKQLVTISATPDIISTIKNSTSNEFEIIVDSTLFTEILIPHAVIKAIADSKKQSSLSIVSKQLKLEFPLQKIVLSHDDDTFVLTLKPSDPATNERINKINKQIGTTLLSEPLAFQLGSKNSKQADSKTTELVSSLGSRYFTLSEKNVDPKRATAVWIDPVTGEYRHLPTLFTTQEDGTVIAELKHSVNGLVAIIERKVSFDDVTASWAMADIEQAVSILIINSQSATEFGFSNEMTRAEFTALIIKGLGLLPNNELTTFSDVDASTPYAKEIGIAAKLGLIKGKLNGAFDPNGTLTRQEMASIMEKAMKISGYAATADQSVLQVYKDQNKISTYAANAMAIMVEQGILVGKSATKLDPLSNVTKAQATAAAMRMLRILKLVQS